MELGMKSSLNSVFSIYVAVFTWALFVAAAAPLHAEQSNYSEQATCATELRECFSLSDEQRNTCFQVTSRRELCLGTPDGALAAKRGTYSSLRSPETDEDGVEMLPEHLVFDKECVANFDTLWLSHLVNEDHSPETCEHLQAALNDCSRQPTFELLRP